MQGYIFKIMGGNDKQGFGMKQGVLTNQRVRLLMKPGQQCFRGYGRRNGEEDSRASREFMCTLKHRICARISQTTARVSPPSSAGERRRKSVRGCIISADLSVLNLKIVKKGEAELPGLTDEEKPRMRGPKRASKIRKLFSLSKVGGSGRYV